MRNNILKCCFVLFVVGAVLTGYEKLREFKGLDEYVDGEICELINSPEFSGGDTKTRKHLTLMLLDRLSEQGYVKGIFYSENSQLFSFTYISGQLGGISLKDFSTDFNEVPVN